MVHVDSSGSKNGRQSSPRRRVGYRISGDGSVIGRGVQAKVRRKKKQKKKSRDGGESDCQGCQETRIPEIRLLFLPKAPVSAPSRLVAVANLGLSGHLTQLPQLPATLRELRDVLPSH